MHLVEIFLPLTDNKGRPFAPDVYERIRDELTDRFGGVTGFGRAPAHGTFRDKGTVVHDDIVVYEVMTAAMDRVWWKNYRKALEQIFEQDEIVIRTINIERL